MDFENGGEFAKPVYAHTQFRLIQGYSWVFSQIEQELVRLGFTIGYESGFIGQGPSDDLLRMSIEIFVGEEDADELAEASFDLTIEETEAGRGRLSYGPMLGAVDVADLDYGSREAGAVIATEPNDALVAKVAEDIHQMARRMITAHREAFE